MSRTLLDVPDLDRLSNITPKIDQLPFNNLGNSHNKVNYSGFVRFIDRTVHEDYKHLKDTNIIKILYDNNILYYERAAMSRAGDANRDINNLHNDISFLKIYNKEFYDRIRTL